MIVAVGMVSAFLALLCAYCLLGWCRRKWFGGNDYIVSIAEGSNPIDGVYYEIRPAVGVLFRPNTVRSSWIRAHGTKEGFAEAERLANDWIKKDKRQRCTAPVARVGYKVKATGEVADYTATEGE